MTIFLAGGSGAIGRRLIPHLISRGHRVIGTTRAPEKLSALQDLGADPLLVDGLDRAGVVKAVVAAHPDAVVHQMTALAGMGNLKRFDEEFSATNRLRTEGTRYLLEAARAAGVRMFIAQSYSGWPSERRGGRIKTEEDPLDSNPPKTMARTLTAIRELEQMVTAASGMSGVVLRYGSLYGPGTSLSADGTIARMIRERKFPLVDGGTGVWSFVHVDDAARATALALERATPGIYNIVDGEPAEVAVWLPALANALGARPPFRLPVWLARFAVGEAGISIMTQVRGSSNAKAKRLLGWQPQYASWREGFRQGLSDLATPHSGV